MKITISALLVLLLSVIGLSDVIGQDTTVVQTFTFNDITKRRGEFVFPDGSESYRKILMKYTLKCDPRTTRDQYDCGEWDYLTYNYVYGHNGVLDSTRKTHSYYLENSVATDSISYIERVFYDYYRETQYTIRHTGTTSVSRDTVGKGNGSTDLTFASAEQVGRSQYIWKASELLAAGLTAGNITGIQLDVAQLGSEMRNFEVKIGHTRIDSLTNQTFINTGLARAYRHNKSFSSTGFKDLQFLTPFVWNGLDNVVIDFSFEGEAKGTNTVVKSELMTFDAGLAVAGSNSYLNFNGNPQWVNLNSEPTITGSKARTIEVWAKIDKFNNAGLFQAGTSGTGKDFSLRTTTTVDQFKAQVWGGGDFTFSFPGAQGKWHHYAMVYDGSTVSIYIDGNFIKSKTTALVTASTDFRVGRWQGSYLFGQLDELRVWDKALTSNTLKQWMNKSVDNSHGDYANLIGYYNFNEGSGLHVADISPKANPKGTLTGLPSWKRYTPQDQFLNKKVSKERPNVIFERGVYTSVLDSTYSMDSVARNPVNLTLFENPAGGVQVPNNSPIHPSLATTNKLVWKANDYSDTYDKATGKRLSWKFIPADTTIKQITKEWYTPDYRIEIGRYITPYGIGLSLGPNGFTWWYDVTDYVQYLRDTVDFQAGNTQELIDLQFLFIKGTPAREVLQVNRVWGQSSSYSYRSLDNDSRLSDTKIDLHKDSKHYRVKTRFTGHGHHSDDGNYPHCCEWKDNTHTLIVNGKKFSDWHIWQTNDCALNPVYPQGGTWLGAREGWCPGDVVKENEFEITDEVSGNSVNLDYSITPVPSNNQKMGNGNYHVAIHMVQYGKANFVNDIEVYDVITPNADGIKSRKGVLCDNPKVVIRNGGSDDLTSAEIRYRVAGGEVQVFKWTGKLKFMEMEQVEIPINEEGFFTGNGSSVFNVRVCNPNGKLDENSENDEMNVAYEIPKVYSGKVVIVLTTNNRPSENSYTVKDINGKIVYEKKSGQLAANKTYNDTLDLAEGCYRFQLDDAANNGLYYGNFSNQGSGLIRFLILKPQGGIDVEPFKNNFGRSLRHAFSIDKKLGEYAVKNTSDETWDCSFPDGTEEYVAGNNLSLFPNPSKGSVFVELMNLKGNYELSVVSVVGHTVMKRDVQVDGYYLKEYKFNDQAPGVYILQLKGEGRLITRRFVIEGN